MEPVDAPCFQSDPCGALALVHARHPVWTRLELATGARDNFRMRRDPPRSSQRGLLLEGGAVVILAVRERWSGWSSASPNVFCRCRSLHGLENVNILIRYAS
jgi:hypothetical protein